MKFQFILSCLCLLLIFGSCDDSSSAGVSNDSGVNTNQPANPKTDAAPPATTPTDATRATHGCDLTGKMMEDNEFWLPGEELLFVIVADTSGLYDKDHPESFRHFQIYNTANCALIGNHVMPVNKEPDYPYYIYPSTFEPTNKVICAQGVDYVYCFDLQRKEMLLPMIPEYLSKRKVTDANSGIPMGLRIWDHYLFGYAQEFGAYAFDLRNKRQVKNLKPVAEFLKVESGGMNQLFITESSPGNYQATFTQFDFDAGENALQVKPLFDTPLPINARLSASARNNNLLVFKYKDGSSAVGIDMAKGQKVDLPKEVSAKSVQDILKWMRSQ